MLEFDSFDGHQGRAVVCCHRALDLSLDWGTYKFS